MFEKLLTIQLVTGITLGNNCSIIATYTDEFNKAYVATFPLTVEVKPKVYTIEVSPTTISIDTGNTTQLTSIVKEDGITISPTLVYTSSNPNIATVNAEGLVTTIAEGTCSIQVTYTDSLSTVYSATSELTVTVPVIADLFTMDWSYLGTVTYAIKKYQTGTYYPHLYNHGVEVTGIAWDFVISNYIAPASATTVTVNTIIDTSLEIKQTSNTLTSGSLFLTATQRNNPSNVVSKTITFVA